MVVISVVVYFKHRLKAFNLTSNVAYTSPGVSVTSHINEHFTNDDNAVNNSSQDQTLATLYDTIEDNTVDLAHVQQRCEGTVTVNLVQNAAYNPWLILPLSPNVAYESHRYRDTEDQDEYEYVK